ncbi:hypothetical protein [Nocardia sp. NPDC005366]|uniref:hypothetical protein n=1 Tax=Nocardia sp. NPDC005366 TaxID=3156878 RepID=UPI0033B8E79D
MTNTTEPNDSSDEPDRIVQWWHRVRTPALTATATVTVCLLEGILGELGARLVDWLC